MARAVALLTTEERRAARGSRRSDGPTPRRFQSALAELLLSGSFARIPWWNVAALSVLALAGSGLAIVPPRVAKWLIDDIVPGGRSEELGELIAVLALVFAARGVNRIVVGTVAVRTTTGLTVDLRTRMFETIAGRSHPLNVSSNEALARLEHDVAAVRQAVAGGLLSLATNLALLLVVTAAMLYEHTLLALFLLAPVPVIVAVALFGWPWVHKRFRVAARSRATLTATIQEAIEGLRTVADPRAQAVFAKRYRAAATHWRARAVTARVSSLVVGGALMLAIDSVLLVTWYGGANAVWAGRLTLGGLVMYLGYLVLFFAPLRALSGLQDPLARGEAAAQRLLFLAGPDRPPAEVRVVSELPPPIRLDGVSFRHNGAGPPLLDSASMEVGAGETVVVTGPSGAGKSSLLRLVSGLERTSSGSVTIGGVCTSMLAQGTVGELVGVAAQPPFLFGGTVADNIALGGVMDPLRLVRAAFSVCAHEFIRTLPLGYDSRLAERGTDLSQGEKQRLSLARVVFLDRPVVILDEAVIGLDEETEARVVASLGVFLTRKTALVATHRSRVATLGDRAFVLDSGRLRADSSRTALPRKSQLAPAILDAERITFSEHDGVLVLKLPGWEGGVVASNLFPLSNPMVCVEFRKISDNEPFAILASAVALPREQKQLLSKHVSARDYHVLLDVFGVESSGAEGAIVTVRNATSVMRLALSTPEEQITQSLDGRVEILDDNGRLWVVLDLWSLSRSARRVLGDFV